MPKTTNKTKVNPHLPPENNGSETVISEAPKTDVLTSPAETDSPEKRILLNAGHGEPLPGKTGEAAKEKRHSLKIVDGKFDTESIRGANEKFIKDTFKNSVSDPGFRNWAGLTTVAAPDEKKFPPQAVAGLLDTGAQIGAAVLSKKSGLEFKEVYPLVEFTKAEHAMLDGQISSLVDKYLSQYDWMKYSDIGVCCFTLITIFKTKAAAVEAFAMKRLENIVTAEPPKPGKVVSTPVAAATATPIAPTPTVPPQQSAPEDKRSLE